MLWNFGADDLSHGPRIEPARAATLPTSAEGLAISGDRAFVPMDGDQPEEGSEYCRVDSIYKVIKPSE